MSSPELSLLTSTPPRWRQPIQAQALHSPLFTNARVFSPQHRSLFERACVGTSRLYCSLLQVQENMIMKRWTNKIPINQLNNSG